ncbi:unnamed protein product [Moneuplotes crassus]|uniref:Uncharacterized protein n=1 Tax=Euplotes crassus TaxID=5936 RepID=A0AAD1YAT4_EUPCR|nr:unnamed protein product [Moneuplotes crassus]
MSPLFSLKGLKNFFSSLLISLLNLLFGSDYYFRGYCRLRLIHAHDEELVCSPKS